MAFTRGAISQFVPNELAWACQHCNNIVWEKYKWSTCLEFEEYHTMVMHPVLALNKGVRHCCGHFQLRKQFHSLDELHKCFNRLRTAIHKVRHFNCQHWSWGAKFINRGGGGEVTILISTTHTRSSQLCYFALSWGPEPQIDCIFTTCFISTVLSTLNINTQQHFIFKVLLFLLLLTNWYATRNRNPVYYKSFMWLKFTSVFARPCEYFCFGCDNCRHWCIGWEGGMGEGDLFASIHAMHHYLSKCLNDNDHYTV